MTPTAIEISDVAAMPARPDNSLDVAQPPLPVNDGGVADLRGDFADVRSTESPYLTTDEAAAYLRKSVSWLLRVPDMAFLRGKPNLYAQTDLDAWVERHKHRPRVKV